MENRLQRKYESLYEPLYKKVLLSIYQRSEIIDGKEDNSDKEELSEKELNILQIKNTNELINIEKGIPFFWKHAISNCYQFNILVNEMDRIILEYLHDVRVKYTENYVKNV